MKKFVRNLVVIVGGVVLACSLSLTGCKKEEPKTEATAEREEQMDGVLVSFAGKTLVVEEGEDKYTFDVSDARIQTKNMRAGDELLVHFEGKLEGTDTSKIRVISVEDLGNNDDQTEKQAVGTLVELTENTITIRQNDGTELLFSSNNCQHEFKNGIREGNWIVVTYKGEIQGTDTKNVTVIKITDHDANVVEKEQKEMKITAVNETVYATAGVHIRESYTTDSKVLGSLAKGGSILRTGVCENGWSRVQYASRDAYIYGEYLTTQKPKEDAPAAKTNGKPPVTAQVGNEPKPVQQPEPEEQKEPVEQKEPEEQPEPTEQPEPEEPVQQEPAEQPEPEEPVQQEETFTGTVLDVSMNTLTVAVEEQEYTIYVADAEHEYANGIQTGNTVTVTYMGSLEDLENLIVIKVEDSDPNEAAQNAVYVGTIVDATMNTLTIQTEDGAVMTFIKEGAENHLEDIVAGQEVKIIADMTISEVEENIFQAKQIDPVEKAE